MQLNTLEKQLADKYLKRYQDNLKYKPQGYISINSQIQKELSEFKKKYPKHGFFLEQKYILGKSQKEIQKTISYCKSQTFIIQSESLTMFIQNINTKSLEQLYQNHQSQSNIKNINLKN